MVLEKLVCAILVNYNGVEDTRECVESLLASNYENLHIIIVDNASQKGRVEYDDIIRNEKCDILYMKQNIGFAGANNVGIRHALQYKPEYVLIINNDTVVEPNFLSPLINACNESSENGIATGKIYYFDERELIWFGGSYFDSKLCECKIDGIGKKEEERHNEKKYIPFATGCLWLIPVSVIQKVGLMSEDYFLYYEDADYCERIKKNGFRICYVPESVIYHKESRSTGKGSDLYHYYNTRNYLIFISKYCTKLQVIAMYFNKMIKTLKDVLRKRIKISVAAGAWSDFLGKKFGKKA
ncbi:glycosyltransferase family 2 protein [Pseudobacteroides cellulosolvens]|uniref:Glycosyl transferase family 2 n=1 Tax=Pseudobacteroides cellulosolvens ATCC 35603 = DSM 2933 TaxID=398512 RepID=A0A0L6JMF7_9FIRM|nr:glycosyltransferase family 2 protein [Pseudobacteroides cellulosolvens]KNY26572.1 glycosyl transferase family 2 [Pseudobacteroides cellulosolvens ATCC 35603 = DSM 2933]